MSHYMSRAIVLLMRWDIWKDIDYNNPVVQRCHATQVPETANVLRSLEYEILSTTFVR